ncbi:MAG: response regulator [Pseudomonadota bacterium]
MACGRPITLLLVEDDELDIIGLQRAIRKLNIDNPVVVAHNGEEALEHLRGENGRRRIEEPFAILLDLNMPRMTGLELLEELREDPHLRNAAVLVLSTSDDEEDKKKTDEYNIAGYVVKSDPTTVLLDAVRLLGCRLTIRAD